jgi:HSP20 family protein
MVPLLVLKYEVVSQSHQQALCAGSKFVLNHLINKSLSPVSQRKQIFVFKFITELTIGRQQMAIIRYEPWGLLNQLQRELKLSQEDNAGEGSIATAEWAPAVDIKEETDKFVIYADISGVKPEDIEISMEAGVLTVKGEKETEVKTEKEGYKRVERTSGSFYRRFSLPDSADGETINAKCKYGVLEIVIPKREAVKPKRINVTSEE